VSAINPDMGLGHDSSKDSYKQVQTDYIGGLGSGSIDELEAEDLLVNTGRYLYYHMLLYSVSKEQ
jgi:hypothetical protein